MRKLAIVTAATKGYLFAWDLCLKKAISSILSYKDGVWIFVTDEEKEGQEAYDKLLAALPQSWTGQLIRLPIKDDTCDNYEVPAQIRIAQLQGAGFDLARKFDPDICLSLESDVVIKSDCVRLLDWTLQMPTADGTPFYDIAMSTYPNGLFLGGRATPGHSIAEDFLEEERKLPEDLKKRLEAHRALEKSHQEKKEPFPEELVKTGRELAKEIKSSPPDGTIWEVIFKHGWRRRGWLDFAYPALGLGALVPTDWVGLGCTMLSRKALSLSDFSGYDGGGTQDLFLCSHRWIPAGLRMAVLPHCPSDHIKPERDKDSKRTGKFTHMQASHEMHGETVGHLRTRHTPFVPL